MKIKLYWQVLFILFLSIATGCDNLICDKITDDNRQSNCESCRILFIGSSYLDYAGNNVMKIFSDLCESTEKETTIERSVHGGYRLHDHIEYQPTIDLINSQGWDYVILQGNSAYISQEKWHEYIVPYLKDLREMIKYNYDKTSVIYMMPWAYLDGLTYLDGETDTYEQMQNNIYDNTISVVSSLDISTAPVGWAWYQAINDGYNHSLYLNDYNHQTFSGAYLTACVFYSTIYQEKAPLIENFVNDDYLRTLAYEIVINDLDTWNIY